MLTGGAMGGGIPVTVEKLAFGGSGICRIDGKVCFVPFTAPGDRALVEVTAAKKSYCEGRLLQCLEPSHLRVVPPCEVFGDCGGCHWQHLDYGAQAEAKERIFAELMTRAAGIDPAVIQPLLRATEPYGYRSRVQFKIRSVAGRLHCGFYRRGSHYVVDLPGKCRIARDGINRIREELCRVLADFPEPDRLPQIDVALGEKEGMLLLFHYIGERGEDTAGWLERTIPGCTGVTGVFLQSGRKATMRMVWGEDRVAYIAVAGDDGNSPRLELRFRAGGFSQVNYAQNRALVRTVLDWAGSGDGGRLLDLYCGNGNFSLPLSRLYSRVVGLEDYHDSVADAAHNAAKNGIDNAEFIARDTDAGLRDLIAAGERFDLVLLDPPRAGARDAVRLIPELGPRRIIYVSCDPSTLGRDLAVLRGKGYRVAACRAVDMFPQTYHLESVTLLEKT